MRFEADDAPSLRDRLTCRPLANLPEVMGSLGTRMRKAAGRFGSSSRDTMLGSLVLSAPRPKPSRDEENSDSSADAVSAFAQRCRRRAGCRR